MNSSPFILFDRPKNEEKKIFLRQNQKLVGSSGQRHTITYICIIDFIAKSIERAHIWNNKTHKIIWFDVINEIILNGE